MLEKTFILLNLFLNITNLLHPAEATKTTNFPIQIKKVYRNTGSAQTGRYIEFSYEEDTNVVKSATFFVDKDLYCGIRISRINGGYKETSLSKPEILYANLQKMWNEQQAQIKQEKK